MGFSLIRQQSDLMVLSNFDLTTTTCPKESTIRSNTIEQPIVSRTYDRHKVARGKLVRLQKFVHWKLIFCRSPTTLKQNRVVVCDEDLGTP